MARTLRTLTVGELREMLEGYSDDMAVIFSADYGDHCHTMQALPLRGTLDAVFVEETAYSNSGFGVVTNEEREAEAFEADAVQYLLIS